MKRFLPILFIACFNYFVNAQENYTIEGENLELYSAVDGDVSLLWNVIDGQYRYFVVKDGNTQELTNTKGENGRKYQAEYKMVLDEITPETEIATQKVKLTLGSLKKYLNEHNGMVDEAYEFENQATRPSVRLGVFGGVTNVVYSPNPLNKTTGVAGIEMELFHKEKLERHSLFTQIRHIFETEDYKYSQTGISFNYRFKIINSETFHLYAEAEFLEIYHYKEPGFDFDTNMDESSESDVALDFPLSLGVGMAIKISSKTYLTLSYNDFVAAGRDNNGETPIDFTAGLKFNL